MICKSPETIARLVFDSWHAGTLVGTRGTGWEDRMLLYRAGEYCVDLVIENPHLRKVFVSGQVVDEIRGLPVEGAEIRFGRVGLPAETDEHGQFAVMGHFEEGSSPMLQIQAAKTKLTCPIPIAR